MEGSANSVPFPRFRVSNGGGQEWVLRLLVELQLRKHAYHDGRGFLNVNGTAPEADGSDDRNCRLHTPDNAD